MSSVTRAIGSGTARPLSKSPAKIQPARRLGSSSTIAAEAADQFSSELLKANPVSPAMATRALERFRQRARADQVIFWSLTESKATVTLRAGNAGSTKQPQDELTVPAIVGDRLRRSHMLICRAGEVSGVEMLAPAGVRSFVAVAVPANDDAIGVLIVGWDTPEPPCGEYAAASLRLAASTVLWTAARPIERLMPLAQSILDSISQYIVVIDRDGTIVMANGRWNELPMHVSRFGPIHTGANYFKSCDQAATTGGVDAGELKTGVLRVARHEAPSYQTTFRVPADGRDAWILLNVMPLRQASSGAVLAHTIVEPEQAGDIRAGVSERQFYDLTASLPIPVWIHGTDGRVIYGNAQWRQIAKVRADGDKGEWTDLFHPADRARVMAYFASEVGDHSNGVVEARMRSVDGTYRWAVCAGARLPGAASGTAAYVGYCSDSGVRQGERFGDPSSRLAAQDEERSRIARELHDDLGQQAAILAANISALSNGRLGPPRLRNALANLSNNVQELAVSIHNLSHQLHSPRLKLLGLVKTLQAMCRDVSKLQHVRVTFRSKGVPADVPERIALCVCRVTQEAVQNAVKHSGARAVLVELLGDDLQLTLRVTDRGQGFDPVSAVNSGIGLLTMRERVELSGGEFTLDAAPSKGTRIEAILPLPAK